MKSIDSAYIKEIRYEEADSLLKAISYGGELYSVLSKHFVFRGHFSDKYLLLPYALRDGMMDDFYCSRDYEDERVVLASQMEVVQMMCEYELLQRYYNLCDKHHLRVPDCPRLRDSVVKGYDPFSLFLRENWLPKEFWEVAALAQHYGVPTRLLDWSSNIRTALYFAVRDYIKPISLAQLRTRTKDFLENRGKIEEPWSEIWALDTRVVVAKEGTLPLQLIRPPYHGNPNLAAQEGVFTLWTLTKPVRIVDGKYKLDKQFKEQTPLDTLLVQKLEELRTEVRPYLFRIAFPQKAAVDIYSFLEKEGHTAARLFPGYDGVVLSMKEGAEFRDRRERGE